MNKLENIKRIRILVSGLVQGVGFRPTTYRYAHDFSLSGYVLNTPEGVTIEVQGSSEQIDAFVKKLLNNPPPLAKIMSFNTEEIRIKEENSFVILHSNISGNKKTEISSDIAVCDDCISDINDKKNRRYLYPFTNCTNCGPRFSIIQDRPYDRNKTSMSVFEMCEACQKEYDNPNDRRFHAQPNACPKCGPNLKLLVNDSCSNSDNSSLIKQTIKFIEEGKIISIKGIGGFNIVCDPFNKESVKRLRINKNRPSKSFAVMAKNIETVKKYCYISDKEEALLISKEAPIVLLKKKNQLLDDISPDNNYIGFILPYTPLHHIIFRSIDILVMTSANKSDEPIAINDDQIYELIKDKIIDNAITHNREIVNRCDDSIVQIVADKLQVIRRSRGFVPRPLNIGKTIWGDNLSMGADLKNTFSIKTANKIYMSQHIGDLNDVRNYDYQKEEVEQFCKLLDFRPEKVNIDAHPGYQNYDNNNTKIYHHHAHALSVMAEHGLLGKKVLGVICDGTGYGTDGTIWGFEFLEIDNDYRKFNRLYHLEQFLLPGGERAIDEVDRIAISISSGAKKSIFIDKKRYDQISSILDKKINCIRTSSLGRLFDGVASLCGIIQKVNYEAQAAILLQKNAELFNGVIEEHYAVSIEDEELNYKAMIKELVHDINNGVETKEVAYKFHLWVADSIVDVVKKINPEYLVFSGGCFQNVLLCKMLEQKMSDNKVKYFFNNETPINDAGVSLGQSLL